MLREAVDSVLAQTHSNLEVIIVLKGATPTAAAQARALPQIDSRIRVIDMGTNNTLGFARNFGIREAKGKWVAFLDDDDLWMPMKLELQLKAAREHSADFVATNFICFNADGDLPGHFIPKLPPDLTIREAQTIYNYIPAGASTMIVRTSAVRAVDLFDPDLNAVEDWDLWRRLLWHHKFYLVNTVLAKYRRHTSNMSRRSAWMLMRESKHVLKLTLDTPKELRHMIPRAWAELAWRYLAVIYEGINQRGNDLPRSMMRAIKR
jgi:glycosyltransferase involved in cell wall biosynthesis